MMLLIFILVLVSSSICNGNYVSFSCQQIDSYSTGSVFEANLNFTLFTRFPTEANSLSFSNFTKGTGDDQVYAIFYCKGDVDAITCQNCVDAAARKLADACKFKKEAIVWFEDCTLRYANRTIFSISEVDTYYLYYNRTGIVTDYHLQPYEQIFATTMDTLIEQVAYGEDSLKGFGTKQVNLSSYEILQLFAQCTPDIVGSPCDRCLKAALRLRSTWANTVVYLSSCVMRYDLYVTKPPPSLPPTSQSPSRLRGFHIAIILVVLVLLIVVSVVRGSRLYRRRLQEIVPARDGPDPPDNEDNVHRLPTFSYSELGRMTNGFTEVLGTGACGVVYYGHLLDNSQEVAVKLLNNIEGLTQFSNEMDVFKMISHENIVSLLGYCEDGTNFALVCEFMNKGDLKDLLSGSRSLSWTDRLQIAIDTAKGLCYLLDDCSPPIVHRDVKPANILLNEELRAKVADFGYSKIFPADMTTVRTRVIGTSGYTAPEYLSTGRLNYKADVYSFGVVLIQLITGEKPSTGENVVQSFLDKLDTKEIETILDSQIDRDVNHKSVWRVAKVAKSCINGDAAKRPKMSKIIMELKQCLDMELKNTGRGCI